MSSDFKGEAERNASKDLGSFQTGHEMDFVGLRDRHPPIEQKNDISELPVTSATSSASPNDWSKSQSNLLSLFHFTTKKDKVLAGFALFFSTVQGIILPFLAFFVGRMTNSLSLAKEGIEKLIDEISENFLLLIYIGIAIFVAGYIAALLWNILSARQTSHVKKLYFRKLLKFNMTWYDQQILNEVPSCFTDHIINFSASLSIKFHLFWMHIAIVLGGILVSFIKGYILTLILLALTPLMFFFMYLFMRFLQRTEKYQKKHYARAAALSTEAFTHIKTVKSLNGEEHEIKRYSDECVASRDHAVRYGYIGGLLFGSAFFSIYIVYSFAFYISTQMISNRWHNANTGKSYEVGDLLTIYFSNLISIFALGQVSPLYKNLESGKAAVKSIIGIIKTQMEEEQGGFQPERLTGRWEFRDVSFAYPSAPDKFVLKNVNFSIEPGQKIAFVGPSGCGKSTIVQLMQRFYKPTSGVILLNGMDLNSYDLRSLRQRIGYVQQQPILFAKSIRYNVRLGSEVEQDIKDEVVWEALRQVYASDFVDKIDDKLDFYVGTQGGHLSGGQKQRIAISRIVLRRPDVWIFDEATSALDTENENLIQRSIDQITLNSTSVSIAHRLSTIENADCIFVLQEGSIVERGTHSILVHLPRGVYKGMYDLQAGKRDYQNVSMLNLSQNSASGSPSKKMGELSMELNPDVRNLVTDGKDRSRVYAENDEQLDSEDSYQFIEQEQKAEEPKEKKKKAKKAKKENKKRFGLFSFLGPERWYIVLGVLASLLNGAVMPMFGFLLGKTLQFFIDLQNETKATNGADTPKSADIRHNIYMIIIGAVGVTGGSFLFNSLQYGVFNHVGEAYTFNLRCKYFRKMMYSDMSFFDEVHHQPTDLSMHLSEECKVVNSLIGSFFGCIVQSISSFAVALVVAFVFSWRITLVLLAMSPLIFISGVLEAFLLHQVKSKEDDSQFTLVGETLQNIRIVKSLAAEPSILRDFDADCRTEKKKKLLMMWVTSATIGYAQGSMFVVFAVVFRIGAVFIKSDSLETGDFLTTMFSIIIGLFGAGMAAQFLGTVGPAQAASKLLLQKINSDSFIEEDPSGFFPSQAKHLNLKPDFRGEIRFENVSFRYKGQKHRVLKKVSFTLPPNKSIAFVGSSGSGKSTVFQLLLRLYEIQKGSILIDGVNIRDIDVGHLRALFGVVRQEPFLFTGTIAYNVAYNLPLVTREEMIDACDEASANEFIFVHQEEFARDVGSSGNRMSGGQKQRLCIARALIRRPKIYLFDEATSALDAQAELMVQKAIEKVKQMGATITIAHRISTIKNSNVIVVLDGGRVAEKGTYAQLLAKNGKFVEISRLNG